MGGARDKLLFTPGPLTTSLSVKAAMLRDAGSWHFEFNDLVASIRERLLSLAELSRADGWEAILLQGSGTFGVEAVFQTCVPPEGKVAVLTNGAYGERMVLMLKQARIGDAVLRFAENIVLSAEKLDELLGYPTIDPHGDPIPSKDGVMVTRGGMKLSQLKDGQSAQILRISDQDSEKLCYLGQLGLYPDTEIQLLNRAPFGGPLHILVGKPPLQVAQMLGAELAEQIIVTLPQVKETT